MSEISLSDIVNLAKRRKSKHVPKNLKEAIIEGISSGLQISLIAEATGLHPNTLYRWAREGSFKEVKVVAQKDEFSSKRKAANPALTLKLGNFQISIEGWGA